TTRRRIRNGSPCGRFIPSIILKYVSSKRWSGARRTTTQNGIISTTSSTLRTKTRAEARNKDAQSRWHVPGGGAKHEGRRARRQDHHDLLRRLRQRQGRRLALLRLEGRRRDVHARAGDGVGRAAHQRELHRPRLHQGGQRDVAADTRSEERRVG